MFCDIYHASLGFGSISWLRITLFLLLGPLDVGRGTFVSYSMLPCKRHSNPEPLCQPLGQNGDRTLSQTYPDNRPSLLT